MLKNHCQPCGDQGVLCYATSPQVLILPIKQSGSLVMVTVITAYSSFIIKAVAECGRLAPSCAVPSQGGTRSGRCLPESADYSSLSRRTSTERSTSTVVRSGIHG